MCTEWCVLGHINCAMRTRRTLCPLCSLWLNQAMKILLLSDRIPPEGRGGAEAVVWRLARGLADVGHDVHVAASTAGPPFEERRDGIHSYHLHAGYPERYRAWLSLWNPQTAGPLRRLLARLQPDVVNAHNIHAFLSYHALKLAHEAGCGVVFSAHDAMPIVYGKLQQPGAAASYRLPRWANLRRNRFRYNPVRNIAIKRALSRYTHIRTAPSQALATVFADNDMPPLEVVHNGINPDDWQPPDETIVVELRERLGLPGQGVILIAGRLTREKGLRQMLLALDRLRQSLPDVCLLVLTARDFGAQLPPDLGHLRACDYNRRLAERRGIASGIPTGRCRGGTVDLCRSLSDRQPGSHGGRQAGCRHRFRGLAGSRAGRRNRLHRESAASQRIRRLLAAAAARR